LREITGDVFESPARPNEPFELATPDPNNEERWVEMALQQNLSVISSRLAAGTLSEQSLNRLNGLLNDSPQPAEAPPAQAPPATDR
jgi:hypothetical protein